MTLLSTAVMNFCVDPVFVFDNGFADPLLERLDLLIEGVPFFERLRRFVPSRNQLRMPTPFFELSNGVIRFLRRLPSLERLIQFREPHSRFCKGDSFSLPELAILQIAVASASSPSLRVFRRPKMFLDQRCPLSTGVTAYGWFCSSSQTFPVVSVRVT
jgi:hypothetical protein